jgi:hypothetical protein
MEQLDTQICLIMVVIFFFRRKGNVFMCLILVMCMKWKTVLRS